MNSNKKSNVHVTLVFSLIPCLSPFSSSNSLTFKPVSMVAPPAKFQDEMWKFTEAFASSAPPSPRAGPAALLPFSSVPPEIRSQTDGCTLGIGSITVTRKTVPPSPPPCNAVLERQRSGQRSPQPQNLLKGRTEQLLPMSLSVAFSHKGLNIAPDTQREQGLLEH